MSGRHATTLAGEGFTGHLVRVGVTYALHGGSATITVYRMNREAFEPDEALFSFSAGAELADALIAALVPVLESRNANWGRSWVPVENPHKRDEMTD